jgi:hypothetical protein
MTVISIISIITTPIILSTPIILTTSYLASSTTTIATSLGRFILRNYLIYTPNQMDSKLNFIIVRIIRVWRTIYLTNRTLMSILELNNRKLAYPTSSLLSLRIN